jgi:ACS family allantoate permease-like MFS transporter
MAEKPEIDERDSSRDAEIPEKSAAGPDEVIPGTGITEEDIRRGSVVPEQILKHSHDADVALRAFQSYEGQVIQIDEATNKRLLRIIDWHLIPIMCVVYGLNYLDKTTLSYASIMGIKNPPSKGGIGLVGSQYNWLGSMFYFVRFIAIPSVYSSMMLTTFPRAI